MKNIRYRLNQVMWKLYFKAQKVRQDAGDTLAAKDGEAYIDTVVKILIAVVIGGVLFYAVYKIMNEDVIVRLKEALEIMFSKDVGSGF